jgi:hypothetical protein
MSPTGTHLGIYICDKEYVICCQAVFFCPTDRTIYSAMIYQRKRGAMQYVMQLY